MHKNIPIGTLITAYHKGYFILSRIETRKRNSDLYYYMKVADASGNPIKSKKEQVCDEMWCNIADPQEIYDAEISAAEKKFNALKVYKS